jgi:hypothetical protein
MLRGTTCPHPIVNNLGEGYYLSTPTQEGVGITYTWQTPLWHGVIYPPSPLCLGIPLYYMSECQFRGDNPLYNDFKIFGKNCSLFPLPYIWEMRGSNSFIVNKISLQRVFQNTTPSFKKVLYCEKKFLEKLSEIDLFLRNDFIKI